MSRIQNECRKDLGGIVVSRFVYQKNKKIVVSRFRLFFKEKIMRTDMTSLALSLIPAQPLTH